MLKHTSPIWPPLDDDAHRVARADDQSTHRDEGADAQEIGVKTKDYVHEWGHPTKRTKAGGVEKFYGGSSEATAAPPGWNLDLTFGPADVVTEFQRTTGRKNRDDRLSV